MRAVKSFLRFCLCAISLTTVSHATREETQPHTLAMIRRMAFQPIGVENGNHGVRVGPDVNGRDKPTRHGVKAANRQVSPLAMQMSDKDRMVPSKLLSRERKTRWGEGSFFVDISISQHRHAARKSPSYFEETWGHVLNKTEQASSRSRSSSPASRSKTMSLDEMMSVREEGESEVELEAQVEVRAEHKCKQMHIDFANRLADVSAEVLRQNFRRCGKSGDNGKKTVEEVEEEVKEEVIKAVRRYYPDACVASSDSDAERLVRSSEHKYVWLVEAISGKEAFLAGVPNFTTMIGLLRGGEAMLGIIDQPLTQERWTGAIGHPTTLNCIPVSTDSSVFDLAQCVAYLSSQPSASSPVARSISPSTILAADAGYSMGLVAAGVGHVALHEDMNMRAR
eukprot:767595-Hanusia_phi.AAC.1